MSVYENGNAGVRKLTSAYELKEFHGLGRIKKATPLPRTMTYEFNRDLSNIAFGAKDKETTTLQGWIFKSYSHRDDNLVCTAVIRGLAVVIKTLMTHWQEQPE